MERLTQVSIPFKREGVSQGMRKREQMEEKNRFNSLQTGRCITRPHATKCESPKHSFNSLQTGRCITSQLISEQRHRSLMFQFPSNGKVYHKLLSPASHHDPNLGFNSLQTGRCITSLSSCLSHLWRDKVSIPFKREGVSQDSQQIKRTTEIIICFNSLQTGRCITSMPS